MAVPAGVIIGWPSTAGSIPSGWTQVASLNDRYLKGAPASTNPGGTGGSSTHSHGTPGHIHSMDHSHSTATNTAAGSGSVSRAFFSPLGSTEATPSHTHSRPSTNTASVSSSTGSPGTGSESNDPANVGMIWIQSNGSPSGIPNGAVAFFGNASLPSNWPLYANAASRFCKGHATAGGSTSAGNLSHNHSINSHGHSGSSHSHTSPNTGQASAGEPATGSDGLSGIPVTTHTHPITVSSATAAALNSASGGSSGTTGAAEPSFRVLGVLQNNSGSQQLPAGIIAAWLGTLASIPANWALCDGTNGTPDMRNRYVKGAANTGQIGTTGGSTGSHTHSGGSHSHTSSASHSHSSSAGSATQVSITKASGSESRSSSGHTHSLTSTNSSTPGVGSSSAGTLSSTGTEPVHTQVAFIQYQGVAATGDVSDAIVSASGAGVALPGLGSNAGRLLVVISFDRAASADAEFVAGDSSLQDAVDKVYQRNTLPGDPDHRRNIYAFAGIIPEGISNTTIDVNNNGQVCAWIALIVNVTDATLAGVSSNDSGSSTTSSQGTGSTGQVGAGDVVLVTGEVARGGTTATWSTTDNTPANPFGGDWDLRLAGSVAGDLHGSVGFAYLPAQSQGSYSDSVAYGTSREATALILAFSVGGAILAFPSGEGSLSATISDVFVSETGIVRSDGTVLRAYMFNGTDLIEFGPSIFRE